MQNMNTTKILKLLKQDDFIEIPNHGKWIEENASIFVKEIKEEVFLLFVIDESTVNKSVRAMIAEFDGMDSISFREPKQLMFYLTLQKPEDMHYFEKYMNIVHTT